MGDELIRSYQRAWIVERKFTGFPPYWTSPRPIPWRFFIYLAPIVLLTVLLAWFPGINLIWNVFPLVGPHVQQVAFALGLAWLLSSARIEGRWFHSELRSRVRSWRMPKWIAGCYWPVDDVDEFVAIGRIKLIERGRERG